MIRRLATEARGLRHVGVLFTGTALAQLVPLAVSPVLGRLFSPAEFGALAAFLAIASIITIAVAGRYELAIIPAHSDRRAATLLRLAILLAICTSVAGAVLLPAGNILFGHLPTYFYLLPLSVFLLAAERTCNYWLSRQSAFSQLSLNRLLQGIGTAIAQVGSGVLGVGLWGLVGGQVFGQLTAFALARRSARAAGLRADPRLGRARFATRVACRYREYPTFMIPAGLANEAAAQLPLLIFAGSFGAELLGYFAIAQRLLMAPVSLLATAVGDVFRGQAAAAYRESGNCLALLRRYLGFVAATGLIVILPFMLFGEAVFTTVVGPQWAYAGELAGILAMLAYAQLVSLPFAQTSLLAGLQHVDFAWNVARLAANVIILFACIWSGRDFESTLLAYCCVNSVLYLIHLYIQFHAARGLPPARVKSGAP